VRAFERRASARVLGLQRLLVAFRLQDLYEGVRLEGIFRACARAPSGQVCEFLGFGIFRGRIVFKTFAKLVSRASFVRVFERRASVRVLGPRRLLSARRLHDLHGRVRLEGVFRASVRAPGECACS